MTTSRNIYGVRPVLEALDSRAVDRVYIARSGGGKTQRIRKAAKAKGVKVVDASKDELEKQAGTSKHQGVVARLAGNEVETVEIDDMIDTAEAKKQTPLIVLLDGVQDPHNLGAIMRSAYALGAHGIVIQKVRAAQVTAAAVRSSAGAALLLPVARVGNLKHALDRAVKRGLWTAAAVMDGEPVNKVRLDGPLALVIGGEGEGVRPSVASGCDHRVAIPLSGGFDSLNASVAAGIILYEVSRQRKETR